MLDPSSDPQHGVYVTDIHGKTYIDGLAGLWSTSLGSSEPRLVEAARKQMATLPFYHSVCCPLSRRRRRLFHRPRGIFVLPRLHPTGAQRVRSCLTRVQALTPYPPLFPPCHQFWNRTTDTTMALADEMLKLARPLNMAKVLFTSSGSEANDTHVKMVRCASLVSHGGCARP